MKEVRTVTSASLGEPGGPAPGDAGVAIDRVYFPERTKRAQLFEGDARAAAAKLVEKLRFEARVI
jgi:electron transfer flavoprotein beta subunit